MNYLLTITLCKYSPAYGDDISLRMPHSDGEAIEELYGDTAILTRMRDRDATAEEVLSQLRWHAENTKKGDRVTVFFSGHGTFYDLDKGGKSVRKTGRVCYNRILWDHEIPEVLKLFKEGVLVIFITDSCHSESVNRSAEPSQYYKWCTTKSMRSPAAPPKATLARLDKCKCSTYSLSACDIFQTAKETDSGGVFTRAMVKALKNNPKLSLRYLKRDCINNIFPLFKQTPKAEYTRFKDHIDQPLIIEHGGNSNFPT